VKSTSIRRRQRDIETFVEALGRFLAVMEQLEDTFLGPTLAPRPGHETEAARLHFEVDRHAGRAAHALAAAGSYVDWKPRGTMQRQPVSPAGAWSTILNSDPMFTPDVILACCSQALGILDMQAEDAEEEERHPVRPARQHLPTVLAAPGSAHIGTVAKAAGTVAGGLLAAFLAYWFGWS